MIIGYGRVSTFEQNLDLQTDALTKNGCERIFSEKVSGKSKERPQLKKMLELIRTGDTVVVWRLDRLGRSTPDLIEIVETFKTKGIAFRSLTESIDTSTATGRLVFNFFASLAEFERNLIQERTNAGLAAARARGRIGGRKPGLSEHAELVANAAKTMYDNGDTANKICRSLKIGSKKTLYKYLRLKGAKIGPELLTTKIPDPA